MTTRITLEDDLADQIERLRQEKELTFDQTVNAIIRQGLAKMEPPKPGRPYTQPVSLGGCLIESLDNISSVLAIAEGEGFR